MTIQVNPQDPPVIRSLVERLGKIDDELDRIELQSGYLKFGKEYLDCLYAIDKLLPDRREISIELAYWRKIQSDNPTNEALWSDPKEQADVEVSHE